MKLTPFGKLFLALVVLGVVGFVVFKRYGDNLRSWSGAKTTSSDGTSGESASSVLPSTAMVAARTGESGKSCATAGVQTATNVAAKARRYRFICR